MHRELWEQASLRTLSAAAAETRALPHVPPCPHIAPGCRPALSPTPFHLFLGIVQHRMGLTQLIAPRTARPWQRDVPTFAGAVLPRLCEALGMSRAPTSAGGCLKSSATSLKQSIFRALMVAAEGSKVQTSVSILRARKRPDELENFKKILAIDTSLR